MTKTCTIAYYIHSERVHHRHHHHHQSQNQQEDQRLSPDAMHLDDGYQIPTKMGTCDKLTFQER